MVPLTRVPFWVPIFDPPPYCERGVGHTQEQPSYLGPSPPSMGLHGSNLYSQNGLDMSPGLLKRGDPSIHSGASLQQGKATPSVIPGGLPGLPQITIRQLPQINWCINRWCAPLQINSFPLRWDTTLIKKTGLMHHGFPLPWL